MIDLIPPGVVLILAGLLIAVARGPVRNAILLGAPLLTLALVWLLPEGAAWTTTWLGMEVTPIKSDALARIFATVFALMAFAGGLFSWTQTNRLETAAAFVYAGGAIGVTFAGDLVTLFAFWELMAIGSTIVIWMGGAGAAAAGLRYAIIHFFGGALLMVGLGGHYADTGSVAFEAMQADSWAHWAILLAFLINAGAPPIGAWLTDSYPKASWSGTVFLSTYTTKTAVYVLIRGFPGEEILIWVGLFMIFYGIIYAILENDMRRILAFSIVNQVGFMVCAVGIGTDLALNGAAAHAFAHIVYKAVLMMSAGSVLYMTGISKCTDLGGLFRTMPISCVCGIVGGLSISAFPMTSGFVAKSLITSAAGKEGLLEVWLGLTAASACAFLYVGLKYPWFVFFNRDSGLRPSDPPAPMRVAMVSLAVLCVVLGIFYQPLYAMLPYDVKYAPYSLDHVVLQLQLLLFAGLAFFVLLPLLRRTPTITLDLDWFWRTGGTGIGRAVAWIVRGLSDAFYGAAGWISGRTIAILSRDNRADGVLARTRPSGMMAFWMAVLLSTFLVFSFV